MTSGDSNFNDFPENQLIHLGEMPEVGGRFARVGGFSPTIVYMQKVARSVCLEYVDSSVTFGG